MFALINTQNSSDLSSTPLKCGFKPSSHEIGEKKVHFYGCISTEIHISEEWIGAMHCMSNGILNRIVDTHSSFHFIGVVASEIRSDNIMTVGLHTQIRLRFGLWLLNTSFYLLFFAALIVLMRFSIGLNLLGFGWQCV